MKYCDNLTPEMLKIKQVQDGYSTKSGINVGDGLVHGHVDQAPAQTEVGQHQQAFLQPLVEHQQGLAAPSAHRVEAQENQSF